jgi:hypothetical protein
VEVEAAARPSVGVDVRETRLRRQVVAVGVHVLAEQRDLPVARGRDRSGLVDDLVERPAALRAATERDDAVGARLVAAVDDRQPGGGRRFASNGTAAHGPGPRPREVVRGADERPAHQRRCGGHDPDGRLRRRQPQPVDELRLLVGPQEQVDRREAALEARSVGFADRAARHHDAQPRVRVLQPGEMALPADHLLLRGLADRAGVDHDQARLVERRRLGAARREQAAGHLLGVAPVHLAAQRPDVEGGQRPRLGPVLIETVIVGRSRTARRHERRRSDDVEHGQAAEAHSVGHRRHGTAWRRSNLRASSRRTT